MKLVERACEFEFVEGGDMVLAFPFWPDYVAGTEGYDIDDAIDMARDMLAILVEDYKELGKEVPELVEGNEPRYGGKVMTVAYTEVEL